MKTQVIKLTSTILILIVLLSVSLVGVQAQANQQNVNCALTPEQILGQAFGATAGAAGETAEGESTPDGQDILDNELNVSPDWVIENLVYSDTGTNPVAILIVDDFSGEPYDPEDENMVAHGWLVLDVLEQLHADLPEALADLILLEPVNIADDTGYRSDLIQQAINDSIDTLSAEGYERFVVNMSFVFIPCVDRGRGFDFDAFLAARAENPGLSVIEELGGDIDYVRGLLNDPRVASIDENGLEIDEDASGRGNVPAFVRDQVNILRFFEDSRLQADPLRGFFGDLDALVIPVASSGNFKWRRPFYPARWTEVISVSASEGHDLGLWSHSNAASVMVPGAWFEFTDEIYRAGTSFAAPVASLMIALDLTQDTPTCGLNQRSPELSSANFDNPTLAEAVEDRC